MAQAALYLPDDVKAGKDEKHEFEILMDKMQPGWREKVVRSIYRP